MPHHAVPAKRLLAVVVLPAKKSPVEPCLGLPCLPRREPPCLADQSLPALTSRTMPCPPLRCLPKILALSRVALPAESGRAVPITSIAHKILKFSLSAMEGVLH